MEEMLVLYRLGGEVLLFGPRSKCYIHGIASRSGPVIETWCLQNQLPRILTFVPRGEKE